MKNYNKLYITTDRRYKSRYVLTHQGEEYLRKNFPVTSNDKMAEVLGCGKRRVLKFAQALGIKKDAEYISQCCRAAARCVSQSDFEKFLDNGRNFHKTEEFKEMMKTIQEKNRRTRRMEYIRLLNGEDQRTNIIFREPYSAKRKWYRIAMKRRNYIPETSKKTLVFYYTDDTKRNLEVENKARKVGFTFHPFR